MEQKISGKIDNYYFNKAIDRRYTESTQHHHPHYEIYYMKDGGCRYNIDDRSFDIESGDLVFIPKGIIHRVNYATTSHSRLLINFTEDYIPADVMEKWPDGRFLFRSREIARYAEDILNKIEQEYALNDEYTKSVLKCHTAELLYLMLRHPGSLEAATTGNELVDSIVKYVKQNYTTEIKLSSVAKMKSVSQEHLSRIFKNATGFGFNEYVTLLRLRKADELIRTQPGMSISEIAYECGFNDGNYFSYKYKKMYGFSPMKARNDK